MNNIAGKISPIFSKPLQRALALSLAENRLLEKFIASDYYSYIAVVKVPLPVIAAPPPVLPFVRSIVNPPADAIALGYCIGFDNNDIALNSIEYLITLNGGKLITQSPRFYAIELGNIYTSRFEIFPRAIFMSKNDQLFLDIRHPQNNIDFNAYCSLIMLTSYKGQMS